MRSESETEDELSGGSSSSDDSNLFDVGRRPHPGWHPAAGVQKPAKESKLGTSDKGRLESRLGGYWREEEEGSDTTRTGSGKVQRLKKRSVSANGTGTGKSATGTGEGGGKSKQKSRDSAGKAAAKKTLRRSKKQQQQQRRQQQQQQRQRQQGVSSGDISPLDSDADNTDDIEEFQKPKGRPTSRSSREIKSSAAGAKKKSSGTASKSSSSRGVIASSGSSGNSSRRGQTEHERSHKQAERTLSFSSSDSESELSGIRNSSSSASGRAKTSTATVHASKASQRQRRGEKSQAAPVPRPPAGRNFGIPPGADAKKHVEGRLVWATSDAKEITRAIAHASEGDKQLTRSHTFAKLGQLTKDKSVRRIFKAIQRHPDLTKTSASHNAFYAAFSEYFHTEIRRARGLGRRQGAALASEAEGRGLVQVDGINSLCPHELTPKFVFAFSFSAIAPRFSLPHSLSLFLPRLFFFLTRRPYGWRVLLGARQQDGGHQRCRRRDRRHARQPRQLVLREVPKS
jgi:hypothetical protein